MLKFFIATSLLFASASLEAKIETVFEILTFPVPESEGAAWNLAHDEKHELGVAIREWVPANETLAEWSEMISVQYLSINAFVDPPETAEDYLGIFEFKLKQKQPGVSLRVIKGGQDDLIAEWALPYGDKQHEIFRLVWTPNGIHRIAYTRRGEQLMPQESKKWLKCLYDAKVDLYDNPAEAEEEAANKQ